MQQQLRRVDVARKEFIATASHELRTPIFSLSGFVELLQDEDLDEETRREFLETMSEQVARLQKLSVDLLDLSRLDSGSVELHTEPVDLAELTRSVAGEFHPFLEEHRTKLRAGRAGRGPERLLRPGASGPDHAYPARQRTSPYAGGHGRDRERAALQRLRRAHGGRHAAPASRRARAPRCSSASTRATRPAAPASDSRSRASWPSAWTAGCCSTTDGGTAFTLELPDGRRRPREEQRAAGARRGGAARSRRAAIRVTTARASRRVRAR